MAYLNGISAYQQINQTGNQSTKKKEEVSALPDAEKPSKMTEKHLTPD